MRASKLRGPCRWCGQVWAKLAMAGVLMMAASCRGDQDIKPTPIDALCQPIPRQQNWFGEYYTRSTGQIHSWPLVEPVPGGRYLHFVGEYGADPPYTFPVYNTTGQLLNTLHLTGFDPLVSSRGWLTYWDLGGQIWKVKLNGDSLKRLPSPAGAFSTFPRWLPDGRHLVANRRYDGSSTYSQLVLLNEAGGVVRVLSDYRLGDRYMPGRYRIASASKLGGTFSRCPTLA